MSRRTRGSTVVSETRSVARFGGGSCGGVAASAAARGFESTVTTIERSLAGQDLRAEGVIRITTTDTLLASVLPPALTAFQQANPRITLDVSVSNALANLSKRDADVAIRPVIDAPETSVGRRICSVAFAIYASATDPRFREHQRIPRGHSLNDPLGQDDRWIAPNDALIGTSVAQWMRSSAQDAQPVFRVDSLLLMRELCAAGAGLAALPCYLSRRQRSASRACAAASQGDDNRAVGAHTHPDLARTTRVRLFVDHVASALARARRSKG